MKKSAGCNGRSQRLKICSVSKVDEMNIYIYFFFLFTIKLYKLHIQNIILLYNYNIIIQFTSAS